MGADTVETHKEYCDLAEVPCREGCGAKVKSKDMDEHVENECPEGLLPCSKCGEKDLKRKDMDAHQDKCGAKEHLDRAKGKAKADTDDTEDLPNLKPFSGCTVVDYPKERCCIVSGSRLQSDAAGIKVKDLVIAVNGQKVRTKKEYGKIVMASMPGNEYEYTVKRGKRVMKLMLEMGSKDVPQEQVQEWNRKMNARNMRDQMKKKKK